MRVGVDVGGTFTKAVAFDAEQGVVVAECVVPTTHDHPDGVAAGVVHAVREVAVAVGPERIDLVTHSTTQAVNALLEGDTATVGMIGMGRAPDLRKARRRTTTANIELTPDRRLAMVTTFLDVTAGLDADAARREVAGLRDRGAGAIAVAEAFAPDDTSNEATVAAAASELGLPVTTSTELSGLYGLELRAVTAALNASILPIALRTAEVVDSGVAAAGVAGGVMVMRGDGGATDLDGFRTGPARTLYSGPAASVAGALRSGRIDDGVIVEVGGTSTNVAAIRRGRPALSYVQVASHATAIRALDVRVIGVAGGSMLRARRGRFGGLGVYGVGPRSAHIAGCLYSCFLTPAELEGATAELVAPRPGDPADHVLLRLADGRAAALTNTCAANALGYVEPGDHALGSRDAALAGFAVAGALLRLPAEEVARRVLEASTQAVGDLVAAVAHAYELEKPAVVAVGGGAGGLGRAVARAMGLEIIVPPHAEVISAIGDALSLVRAERERTLADPTPADIEALITEVEQEAIEAGAAASSLDAHVEQIPDRSAVRVTVTGAVGLETGALPGRQPASADDARRVAAERGYASVDAAEPFWVCREHRSGKRVAVLDRYADVVLDVDGETLEGDTAADPAAVAAAVERHTRRLGPMNVAPDAWVLHGARIMQLADAEPDLVVGSIAIARSRAGTAIAIIGRD